MPIHDLGYRPWQGARVPELGRFWAIAVTGGRLAWRNRWLRRILYMTWLPAVYLSVGFLLYEQWLTQGGGERALTDFLSGFPVVRNRHEAWSWLLWVFFRYPQAVLMVVVVGLIAPPLIAQDVRTRAFLLYFSRPITRLEYLLGKMSIVGGYLLAITAAPGLLMYLAALLLSSDLGAIGQTWDLPLRIVAASLVLVLPTTALALCFSSLTSDTRYATFAWFAVWAVGWITYGLLMTNLSAGASEHWELVSLYHSLGRVERWVFGLETGEFVTKVLPAAVELAALTVVSLAVLVRRVSSPMRI
jgi:ABC-2 type transport system permease protein